MEFKYLGCVFDEPNTDEGDCCRKMVSGRRDASADNSLVNARVLQIECARILH